MVELQEDLRSAVGDGQITAVYQPQIDVPSGKVVGVETLARWNHPTLGLLTPDRFIPLAERGTDILDIGMAMLEAGWRLACAMHAAATPLDVAVNVSARQLADPHLPDRVWQLLGGSDTPPASLTLEITESHAILDVAGVAHRLRGLRDVGVGVSIDDFGVGYSSMERIEELPVNEIKVDISMVQDMSDAGYASFLEIVEYAHARGIRVVAEGVETAEQRARVAALRCQRAQGWLFAKPLDEAALRELVARGARLGPEV